MYEVSVVVVTYKPKIEKLIFTLESIIKQRDIKIQIVIADDGSQNNLFSEIVSFFEKKQFRDYKLVEHLKNNGTVKNVFDGVKSAEAKYVKLISPGDGFIEKTDLSEWVRYLQQSSKRWSFCDAIYYKHTSDGKFEASPQMANPQLIKEYIKEETLKCRWNYVVLDDITLGAATLCEKELLENYLQLIVGKVKYAEDNVYRLMMFDGNCAYYYPKELIMYEVGEGISTSGNDIWKERLKADWQNTDIIMFNRNIKLDKFQLKLKRELEKKKSIKLYKYFIKGNQLFMLKRHFHKRMTSDTIS